MKNLNLYILVILLGSIFFTCSDDASVVGSSETGVAGSYARFMIVEDYMYIIDNQNIKTYSLDNAIEPELISEKAIGERIESIFHRDGKLFIGSGIGMFIYTINQAGIPMYTSEFSYDIFPIFPCDPVVANNTHAYVTLNTSIRSSTCRGTTTEQINQLNIFDLSDIEKPLLINEIPMVKPKGLGLDGNTLFICDDVAGLKIFDVSDVMNLTMIAHFDTFNAYDVIPLDGLLLVVGPDNVYQFDYTDLDNITLISTIPIEA